MCLRISNDHYKIFFFSSVSCFYFFSCCSFKWDQYQFTTVLILPLKLWQSSYGFTSMEVPILHNLHNACHVWIWLSFPTFIWDRKRGNVLRISVSLISFRAIPTLAVGAKQKASWWILTVWKWWRRWEVQELLWFKFVTFFGSRFTKQTFSSFGKWEMIFFVLRKWELSSATLFSILSWM